MNTTKIINACKEIYRDFIGMSRPKRNEDGNILSYIIHLYNTTEIDFEEVRFLWINYLEKGNLEISEAMRMARERIAYWEDVRETEDELINWLHRGV